MDYAMSEERFEDEDEQLKKNISSFWVKAMMSLVAYCAQKFRRKQLVASNCTLSTCTGLSQKFRDWSS